MAYFKCYFCVNHCGKVLNPTIEEFSPRLLHCKMCLSLREILLLSFCFFLLRRIGTNCSILCDYLVELIELNYLFVM